ncbi:MAG: hypothetical protein ABIS01_04545 [Ferruginibacter sp.]
MEENLGLSLVAYVKDYCRSEFNNFDLGDMPFEEKYGLFRYYMLGKFFAEQLDDKESYKSKLIDEAVQANNLDYAIRSGYEQAIR